MTIVNVNSTAGAGFTPPAEPVKTTPEAVPKPTIADTRQAIAELQAKAAEAAASKPDVEAVRAAAESLSQYIDVSSRSLNITIDQDLREPIVTVLDSETEQIIRQIPSEELLAIAKFIESQAAKQGATPDALTGVLLKEAT